MNCFRFRVWNSGCTDSSMTEKEKGGDELPRSGGAVTEDWRATKEICTTHQQHQHKSINGLWVIRNLCSNRNPMSCAICPFSVVVRGGSTYKSIQLETKLKERTHHFWRYVSSPPQIFCAVVCVVTYFHCWAHDIAAHQKWYSSNCSHSTRCSQIFKFIIQYTCSRFTASIPFEKGIYARRIITWAGLCLCTPSKTTKISENLTSK